MNIFMKYSAPALNSELSGSRMREWGWETVKKWK